MRAAAFISASAALALSSAGAEAQAPRDRSAHLTTRDISPAAKARDTMNRYGECVVRQRATAVRRALSQPTYEAVNSELAKLAIGECLSDGDLQMGEQLFRGAVYRALYIRDFGRDAALPSSEIALEASQEPLFAFGNCVTALDPAHARAFVLAAPVTPEEDDAVAQLGGSFGRCLAPGNEMRFSKSVLQGALAEALYKRTAASAALPDQAEVN